MRKETYPSEKRNVGAESGGREVSMDGENPASLDAAITANGGTAAEKERVLILISIFVVALCTVLLGQD